MIVGGGLAGLAAAAHLSHKGKKVILLERGVLGGRATSILRQFENELGLRIDWRDINPIKAKYDIGNCG